MVLDWLEAAELRLGSWCPLSAMAKRSAQLERLSRLLLLLSFTSFAVCILALSDVQLALGAMLFVSSVGMFMLGKLLAAHQAQRRLRRAPLFDDWITRNAGNR